MSVRRRALVSRPWWTLWGVALLGCTSSAGRDPTCIQEDTVLRAFVEPESNVILVTVDGVRWQEFYRGADPALGEGAAFPRFWASVAPRGLVFDAEIANPIHLSLPGYQSIFAGSVQPCGDNACGQIRAATFPERLVSDLALPRRAVASFASWASLLFAIESRPGATFIDAGQCCGEAGAGQGHACPGAALSPSSALPTSSPAALPARADALTMARALRYLERQRPAFLYISLNDADEEGHRGQYDRYLAALRSADRSIEEIEQTLDRMGEYGRRTALLITTDHGRGEGARWSDHGAVAVGNADARIWMYLRLPPSGRFAFATAFGRASHLDIRPTIEALFGLTPRVGAGLGRSMVVRADPSRPSP
jgi:hypothetical protein